MNRSLILVAALAWIGARGPAIAEPGERSAATLESLAHEGNVRHWLDDRPRRPLSPWPCVLSSRSARDSISREAIRGVLRQVESETLRPTESASVGSAARRIEAWIELRDAALAGGCYANWVAVDQLHRVAALEWMETLVATRLAPSARELPDRSVLGSLDRENLTSSRAERLLDSEPTGERPSKVPPHQGEEVSGTKPDELSRVLESRLGDLGSVLLPHDPDSFGAYWLLDQADSGALVRRISMTDELRDALLPLLVLASEQTSGTEKDRLRAAFAEHEVLAGFSSSLLSPRAPIDPGGAEAFITDLRRAGKGDLLFFDNSREARSRRALATAAFRWQRVDGGVMVFSPLVLAIEIELQNLAGLLVSSPGWKGTDPPAFEVVVTSPKGDSIPARVLGIGGGTRDGGLANVDGKGTFRLSLVVGWRGDGAGGPLFGEPGTYRVKGLYRPLVLGSGKGKHLDPSVIRESETWTIQVTAAPPGDLACAKALSTLGWLEEGIVGSLRDTDQRTPPPLPTECAGTSFEPRLLLVDLERAIHAREMGEPGTISPRQRAEVDRFAADSTFALRIKAEELKFRLLRLSEGNGAPR